MSEFETLPASPPPDDEYRKREMDLRERELAAREREISAKEAEIKKSAWLNPLVIALFVAAIGFGGNAVVTLLNNQNSMRVEQFRTQSNLMIDSMKTDQQKACLNLLFLADLKIVYDPQGAIKDVCKNRPQQAPSLGPSIIVNAPIPANVKEGAPMGTTFLSNYKKDGIDCVSETVKVSANGWEERTATSDSPAGCKVDFFVFTYTERVSDDPEYILLYDAGRNLFARIPNIAVGKTGITDWRLAFNQTWNTGRTVIRVK
jgi:hypothetical protein